MLSEEEWRDVWVYAVPAFVVTGPLPLALIVWVGAMCGDVVFRHILAVVWATH